MSETRGDGGDGLHASLARRIARVRERYEAAWMGVARGGPQPTLEDFLGDSAEPERSMIAAALSAVDRERDSQPATMPTIVEGDEGSIPDDYIPTLRGDPGGDRPTVAPTAMLPVDRYAATMAPTEAFGTMLDRRAAAAGEGGPEPTVMPTAAFTRAPGTVGPGLGETMPLDASGVTLEIVENPRPDPAPAGRKGKAPRAMPKVDGYELLGELGRGGMGVVYKALHLKLDRVVALKMVLAAGHASQSQLDRFILEAQAVARLQHPEIVQVFEVGEHQGLPFFSLEFVEGGTLHDKLGGKPMAPARAAEMVMMIAGAMQAAHSKHIIHRDLKPANILLTPEGLPKVTDFGLAKKMEGDSQQTRDGAVMGTPSYMAPEQAWGRTAEIGPAADQYALGAILYELLTGHPPFVGATALETLDLARTTEPVPPRRLLPKIPVDIETICLKAMQKEIDKRYADCEALATDLQHFLEGKPIAARPVGPAEKAWRWCRRNPGIAGLSAAVVLLMVGATAVSTGAAITISKKNEALAKQTTKAVEQTKLAIKNEQTANRNRAEAVKQAKIAAENARVAREEEAKAVAAAKVAEEEREKAVAATGVANGQSIALLDSLFRMVQNVQEELRNTPGMQKLRRTVLDVAREGTGKVAASAAKSPKRDRVYAGIHLKLGNIYEEVGDLDKARDEYGQCEAIRDELAKKNPGDPTITLQLPAAIKNQIGDLTMKKMGNVEAARHYYEQALALRLDRAKLLPGDEPAILDVANQYGLLAEVEMRLGNPEKARAIYDTEVAWRKKLSPEVRADFGIRREESGLEQKLGELAVMLEDRAGARAHFQRSYELRDANAALNNVPAVRRDVGLAQIRLGDFELIDGDNPTAALDYYRKALDVARADAEEDKVDVLYKGDVAGALYRVATAELRLGLADESAKHYAECLDLRKGLASNPKAKITAIDLVLALARCGQAKEAAERMDTILLVPPSDVSIYFQAGCGYALCYGAVAKDRPLESLPPDDRKAAQSYFDKALGSVKLALQYGWKDLHALKTDPDLDAIRKDPRYVDLLSGKVDAAPAPANVAP